MRSTRRHIIETEWLFQLKSDSLLRAIWHKSKVQVLHCRKLVAATVTEQLDASLVIMAMV